MSIELHPWKDLMGLDSPRRHTWMHLSVLQEAKLSSDCQSTSRAEEEPYLYDVVYHFGPLPHLLVSTALNIRNLSLPTAAK